MEKIAIVTGASSGIGRAIADKISQMGYRVYGLGRNFENSDDEPSAKVNIRIDLTDTDQLTDTIGKIRKNGDVAVLVNCAGCAYYGLIDDLNTRKIQEMTRVNLEVPMVLTNLLIKDLKKNEGYIINISSVTAISSNPHGVVYGATKTGLSSFSRSLFDEARKYGIKVCDIKPDMAQTNLYRNADFTADDDLSASLLPEDVADAVEQVLTSRDGVVVNDIVIRPQLHRLKKK